MHKCCSNEFFALRARTFVRISCVRGGHDIEIGSNGGASSIKPTLFVRMTHFSAYYGVLRKKVSINFHVNINDWIRKIKGKKIEDSF